MNLLDLEVGARDYEGEAAESGRRLAGLGVTEEHRMPQRAPAPDLPTGGLLTSAPQMPKTRGEQEYETNPIAATLKEMLIPRPIYQSMYGRNSEYIEQLAQYKVDSKLHEEQEKQRRIFEQVSPLTGRLFDDDPTNDSEAVTRLALIQPDVFGQVAKDYYGRQVNPSEVTYTEGEYQWSPDKEMWQYVTQGSNGKLNFRDMGKDFVPTDRMMPVADLEKAIGDFDQNAFDSGARYDNIVDLQQTMEEIGEESWAAGLKGEVSETWKRVTGTEDVVSMARKQYEGIRTSKAISNLPPGVASDKDIELVLKPFPTSFTNYKQLTDYIEGLRRGEAKIREYQQFGARYLSRPGFGSRRGMAQAWGEHWDKQTSPGGKFYDGDEAPPKRYEVVTGNQSQGSQ